MRARYSAYATGEVQFIVESHHPDRRQEVDPKATEQWSTRSEWLGLEVKRVEAGGRDDDLGKVEFVARYRVRGMTVTHHEIADFAKEDGRWYFVDGREVRPEPKRRDVARVGRNDPCTCGSGKKYKKCCGSAAA